MGFQHRQFIDKWKARLVSGNMGRMTHGTSVYIRTHLIKDAGEKCSSCGWNERNKVTGKVPLEIDHIDGNSENNSESNLRLLCPNCHSLTPYFRNLNRGRGREWRMKQIRKKGDVLLK